MSEKENKMTAAEWAAQDRIARMIILLSDVQIIDLDGGVCWPIGSFAGGKLVKSRSGEYWLCDAYALAEECEYESIQLPVEAVAAALLGDLTDDDLGYDTVELRIADSTYDRLAVRPEELAWWTTEMRYRVLALNGM